MNFLRGNAVLVLTTFALTGIAFVFLCSRLIPNLNERKLGNEQPSKERVLLIQSLIFMFVGGLVLFRNAEDIVGWAIGAAGLVSLGWFFVKMWKIKNTPNL